jgi:hypothetical protein
MNVVVRAWGSLQRLASPGVAALMFCLGGVLAVEIVGRSSPSDLYDLLALVALCPLGILLLARHRRSPVPGIEPLGRALLRLTESLKAMTFQMGLDFRGEPPVKRGVPPVVTGGMIGLGFLALAGVLALPQLPNGLRQLLIRVSFVGYLGLLVGLWLILMATVILAAFVPLAVIHDWFVGRRRGPGPRSRRGEMVAVGGWFGLLFFVGSLLPIWYAPVMMVVLMAVYLLGAIPARAFSVAFLWRPRGSIRVRSLTWTGWVTCEFLLIGLGMLTLTLLSCGSLIVGDDSAWQVMPMTTLLGVALAWLGPGLLGLLCVQMMIGRWRDPARPARPIAHVTLHAGRRADIRRIFRRRGWSVRFGSGPPGPLAVPVAIVAEALPRESADDRWPAVLTADQLDRDGTFVRLARRDEVQKRRLFVTRLEALFKAARQRRRGGCGYWLSPHHWFVTGLMRDGSPGEDGDFDFRDDPILSPSVGPPYARVFPRVVRRHLYDILRGAQIDLIFVEDGVSFKRLRRVLRSLFEVYDVHGGRRPAEEFDFRGLPGVRAVIHEYQFDQPYQSNTYPEPTYDFLGRARILHVFRDRGGEDAFVEPPFDFGRRPEPMLSR